MSESASNLPATGRIRVIGIGPGGPDQLTIEAVRALNQVAAHLVISKRDDDPLAAAREAGVHISEDPDLVELLARVPVGAPIPAELYQTVAQLLAFVYAVNARFKEKLGPMGNR